MIRRPPISPLFPYTTLSRSYALLLDLRATIPADEWPMPPATSPVRAWLALGGQEFLIQPGSTGSPGWNTWSWEVSKTRSEEHTSELQSQSNLVCRLLLEKKKTR